MMKLTDMNSSELSQLQSRLNTMMNSISDRSVSLSAEAHSGEVATILINCSGIRGTMSKTMVIVKRSKKVIINGIDIRQWHAYVNGYEYVLSSIGELQTAIRQQVALMKPLVQYR